VNYLPTTHAADDIFSVNNLRAHLLRLSKLLSFEKRKKINLCGTQKKTKKCQLGKFCLINLLLLFMM